MFLNCPRLAWWQEWSCRTKANRRFFLSLESFFGVFFQAVLAGGTGLIAYVLIAGLLRVEEQSRFLSTLKRSTFRQVRPQEVVSDR